MNPPESGRQSSSRHAIALVAMLTMVAVSSVYWSQAMIVQIRADLGEPALVALLPGATLLGYAIGVTVLAVVSRNLAGRGGLACHAALLAAGLAACAAAPTAGAAVGACVIVGAGCALTQRMLIIATATLPSARRGEVIGLLIASGLTGIVGARAVIEDVAGQIGWRLTFTLDALAVCAIASALFVVLPLTPAAAAARPHSVVNLWHCYATLRRASFHQAVMFAAFNAGWAILPSLVTTAPATRAAVAGIGAMTALIAGRTQRWLRPDLMAATATVVIVIATAVVLFSATRSALLGAMTLLEIATQLALVANQTRAQAVAPDVGSRGRMASLVTAVGFAGGAVGAAAANMLVR